MKCNTVLFIVKLVISEKRICQFKMINVYHYFDLYTCTCLFIGDLNFNQLYGKWVDIFNEYEK